MFNSDIMMHVIRLENTPLNAAHKWQSNRMNHQKLTHNFMVRREMANNQSVRRHLNAFTRGRIIGKLEEGRSVTSVAAEFGIAHSIVSRLWRQFQTTGTAIRGSFSDRYIVVHEHIGTGKNSLYPEETGGRQREKSLPPVTISRFSFDWRPVRCVRRMGSNEWGPQQLIEHPTHLERAHPLEHGQTLVWGTCLAVSQRDPLDHIPYGQNAPCHRTGCY
ncbi:transposable element Tcb2 transposase [Trichonephila clavipes]|nr:transposable element Tcb2 transposase [Trichonephila clavipes]